MSATIGRVGESLRKLLEARMDPSVTVTLLSPGDPSPAASRVNLFLYRVAKHPPLANMEPMPKPGSPNQLVFPPMVLSLFYLLTVFTPLDPQTGLSDSHEIMGEAMRVLYENPIVPAAFLVGGLKPGQAKITFVPADIEELNKIWMALTKEYRLSAVYEVSYVDIPSKAERPIAVRVKGPLVTANATPAFPSVGGMTPLAGPVNTALIFSGRNLANWKVTVRIGGTLAADSALSAADDSFTAAIPAGLSPGVYEVVLDVAGISRFQSTVEVTP